eukprot:g5515.t1
MRSALGLLLCSAVAGQHCASYNHTGVDYADHNITVTIGAQSASDCCVACAAYNAKRPAGAPRCNVAVWWRDALNFTGLCCLKESGEQPVARKLTASVVAPPTPAPAPSFRFAAVYTSDMVLQSAPARAQLWGFCEPGDAVDVDFDGRTLAATTSSWRGAHTWSVALPPTAPSTTAVHRIAARSSRSGAVLTLERVLFGDVYVCSGQSNMAYALSGSNSNEIVHPPVNDSAAEIAGMRRYSGVGAGAGAYANALRLFRVGRPGQADPNTSAPYADVLPPSDGGSNATVPGWSPPCPATGGGAPARCRVDFSAMCYFFGRDLYEALGRSRPIGLVASYVGGTPDEAWSGPGAKARCVPPARTGARADSDDVEAGVEWSYLWNSMIAPLTNTTIKGAVWYQGEADAGRPGGAHGGYNCTFPAMISDWRKQWHAGTGGATSAAFPFGFVQLNSVGNGTVYDDPPAGASAEDPFAPGFGYGGIRWAQTAGYGTAPNPALPAVFMAVSLDTPDRPGPTSFLNGTKVDPGCNVHSPFKQPVAARLARAALPVAYVDDPAAVPVDTASPAFTAAQRAGSGGNGGAAVVVHASGLGEDSGLPLRGDGRGFGLLSPGGKWVSAHITAHNRSSVTLAGVAGATQLRYLWYSNPCGLRPFGCAVYAAAKPLVEGLSGEQPFLPLPPFFAHLV